MKHLSLILGVGLAIVTIVANADDVPSLESRYSQLQDNYNNADQSVDSCDLKPLTQFSQDYSSCYWIIKNTKGEYDGDAFVIGVATYSLTTPTGVLQRTGPAVVYRESYSPNEISLDGIGVTEFPTATHSDAENALAIALKTNIPTIGPATDTSYLRRHSANGDVSLKEVFSAAEGTAIGYGYCWRQVPPQKPR